MAPEDPVAVDALGVVIALPPPVARLVPHLPRTDRAPTATVGEHEPDPIRTLTHLAVTSTPLATFHAGVVGVGGEAVAFPGASGAGKSTLVAACVVAGLDYLSDEVLALRPDTVEVVPFARPLALSARSRRLVGLPDDDPGERFVPPAALGSVATRPARLRHVVIPRRGVSTAVLTPVDASQGVARLVERSFNHYRFPAVVWSVLTSLAGAVDVWEAHYDDARSMSALVLALFSDREQRQ